VGKEGKIIQRKLSASRLLVPLTLLLWLLVSLPLWLLVPHAEAQYADPACPSPSEDPLAGVHNPSRLRVINPCQQASGTVTNFETWSDGDWNIYVDLDQDSEGLVSAKGIQKLREWPQAGGVAEMLWEATPADQGGLLEPSTGQHLEVLGAHVHDKTWGYTEVHPIYKETFDDESTYVRGQDEETS
jgi:hypothetical protein